MRADELRARLRALVAGPMPVPGGGETAARHHRLLEVGREDLSLARLAEAHWDAIAILAEAGREPEPGALYGVWASEKPGEPLTFHERGGLERGGRRAISGRKMFCSGAGLVDRALVTVGAPEAQLVDVRVGGDGVSVEFDYSGWQTSAFAETQTATAAFVEAPVDVEELVGPVGWYLERPGFWHGACGPAACWAGGAARLLDYGLASGRRDAHTLAHLGAMEAGVWNLRAALECAGREIDANPEDARQGRIRARVVRHVVEQTAADLLRRMGRAYGPYPLAMDAGMSRHCQELDLYLRQWHAERDLEALGADAVVSGIGRLIPESQGAAAGAGVRAR